MLALSTCWNSHRFEDGLDLAREARAAGFDHIEISHGTRLPLLPGLMRAFDSGEIKVCSLHNFCPPPVEVMMDAPDAYEFTSREAADRERAIKLTLKTIETAVRFGADRVVLHLGSVPMKGLTHELESMAEKGAAYSREYTRVKLRLVEQRAKAAAECLDRARDALRVLLPVAEQNKVVLAIETRSHFEQVPNEAELLQLLDEFKDTPWLGAWHDFGHVQRKANLGLLNHAEHLEAIAPRLLGCHVHDVAWPAKDHRIPFTGGGVDFARLMPLVPAGIPLVWELSPSQRRLEIIEQAARWRERFGDAPAHPS